MQTIQNYYDELSHRYDVQRSNPYFRLIEELELDVLRQYIPPTGGRVLEMGCGTGIFLKHLQSSGFFLHGLDYTQGMLELALYKLDDPSIKLVHGDGQSLPYASNLFDIVYSFKVLAHLPHLDWALNEIRRVLRPDGIAILEFYNRHSIRYLLHRSGYFHQWHSPIEVRQQIKEAKMSVVSIYGARIATPSAYMMEIPVISHILHYVEKSLSPTAFNRFAGYYIVACQPQ